MIYFRVFTSCLMGVTNDCSLRSDDIDEDSMDVRDIDLSGFSWMFISRQIILICTMIGLSYCINHVFLLKIHIILLLKLAASCYDNYSVNEYDSRKFHKWSRELFGVFIIDLALQFFGIKAGAFLWIGVSAIYFRYIIDTISKLRHMRLNLKIMMYFALTFSPLIFISCNV